MSSTRIRKQIDPWNLPSMQERGRENNDFCGDTVNQYSHLAALGLDGDDLRSLARQGFVSCDRRGERRYYKLRFRRNGRQIVRYLGSEQDASIVQGELDRLQVRLRLERELRVKARMSIQAIRVAKDSLAPLLGEMGYEFHGHAIRRFRKSWPH